MQSAEWFPKVESAEKGGKTFGLSEDGQTEEEVKAWVDEAVRRD
jgi:hypothetical protein